MVFAYGPDIGPVVPSGEHALATRPTARAAATSKKRTRIFRIENLSEQPSPRGPALKSAPRLSGLPYPIGPAGLDLKRLRAPITRAELQDTTGRSVALLLAVNARLSEIGTLDVENPPPTSHRFAEPEILHAPASRIDHDHR